MVFRCSAMAASCLMSVSARATSGIWTAVWPVVLRRFTATSWPDASQCLPILQGHGHQTPSLVNLFPCLLNSRTAIKLSSGSIMEPNLMPAPPASGSGTGIIADQPDKPMRGAEPMQRVELDRPGDLKDRDGHLVLIL